MYKDYLKIVTVNDFSYFTSSFHYSSYISYNANYAHFGNTGPRIFVFVSASLNCPDFLFHVIIVSGPNFLKVIISIWYYAYQDPF